MADSKTKSPEELEKLSKQFREWLKTQPHLPQNLEERMVVRFLHSCYYDLEKSKSAAELFFTLRGSSPDLLDNRDPLSPAMQKALSIVNLAQIQISGNRNLWIWQLNDPGMEKFDYCLDVKLFFLTTDAWLLNDQSLEEEDIIIMDVKDISLKFLTRINLSVQRRLTKYQEEAMPIRIKQIHIVNAPSFIDKIFSLFKTFMSQDKAAMIHFHSAKSINNLYKYLDKEDLPEDFGGTNGKMEDHMKDVMKIILDKRHVAQLRISGNRNLWIWRLNDPGMEKYDYLQDVRMFFLIGDAWLLNEDNLEEEDIVIMDAKDISLKILTKINLGVERRLAKYQEDGMPIRLKQIHIINAPAFIDKIFSFIKPLLKQDMTDMIHFHTSKSIDKIYKYLNKEDLPIDYGGENGRMEDHMKHVMKVILDKRELLMDNNLWRATVKSKNKTSAKDISFQSLNID